MFQEYSSLIKKQTRLCHLEKKTRKTPHKTWVWQNHVIQCLSLRDISITAAESSRGVNCDYGTNVSRKIESWRLKEVGLMPFPLPLNLSSEWRSENWGLSLPMNMYFGRTTTGRLCFSVTNANLDRQYVKDRKSITWNQYSADIYFTHSEKKKTSWTRWNSILGRKLWNATHDFVRHVNNFDGSRL